MDTRERVARAIAVAEGDREDYFALYLPYAEAAIEAMLETVAPPAPIANNVSPEVVQAVWGSAIAAYRKVIREGK